MAKYTVVVTADVEIEVPDDSTAITRATENTDDFQAYMGSHLATRDQVLEHFAYNCVANGIEDAASLDGWADIDRYSVTMRVTNVEFDGIADD